MQEEKQQTNRLEIEVINTSKNKLPEYSTIMSAGMDIRSNNADPIVLGPLERCLVPTGLHIALPKGYEAQIRPRSGLAIKKGITVLNSPGTIDADYRGEVKVIVFNCGKADFEIKYGDRIAQIVPTKLSEIVEFTEVEEISETDRGTGGFGHTGV